MGDRGNIIVRSTSYNSEKPSDIYLYTHSKGSYIKDVLKAALLRRERWDDPAYLTRIIFNELQGDDRGSIGFGISCGICDNEHPLLFVDVDKQEVFTMTESDKKEYDRMSFEKFIES